MEKEEKIVEIVTEAVKREFPGKLDSVMELCGTPVWSDDPVPATEILLIMDCAHSELSGMQDTVHQIAERISKECGVELSIMLQDKKTYAERVSSLPYFDEVNDN